MAKAPTNLDRLSNVAIARSGSDEKIVRVESGRRRQVGYDSINDNLWEIERLTVSEAESVTAELEFRDMSMSGLPWTGIWVKP